MDRPVSIATPVMIADLPEKSMRRVRWILTAGWGILLCSLLYDPLSSQLTAGSSLVSPFRLGPSRCVEFQGRCFEAAPYSLGNFVFWMVVVPACIFVLLVFGHDFWRRSCPLSFVSQLPGALKLQRQRRRVHTGTGKIYREGVTISGYSWLGQNHSSLQFGLLFLGLCGHLLFANSSRTALFALSRTTILTAIAVGKIRARQLRCDEAIFSF